MEFILSYDEFINEAKTGAIVQWVDSGKITQSEFDNILSIDPSRGKFINSIIKWYIDGNKLDILKNIINKYWILKNKNLIQPEINKYKSFNDIVVDVNLKYNDLYSAKTSSWRKFGNLSFEVLQNDDNIYAAKLNSLADLVYFGDNSGWCVADSSHYDVKEIYDNYISRGNSLFVFVFNKNLNLKNNSSKLLLFNSNVGKEMQALHNDYDIKIDRTFFKKSKVNNNIIDIFYSSLNKLDFSGFNPEQVDFLLDFYGENVIDNFYLNILRTRQLKNGIMYLDFYGFNMQQLDLIHFTITNKNSTIKIEPQIKNIEFNTLDVPFTKEIMQKLKDINNLINNNLVCYAEVEIHKNVDEIIYIPNGVEQITIDHNSKLKEIKNLNDKVKKLKINYCANLQSLDNLPNSLSELSITDCPKILSLDKLPNNLKTLDIMDCHNLKSVDKLPTYLAQLSLYDCSNIKSVDKLPIYLHYLQITIPHMDDLSNLPMKLYLILSDIKNEKILDTIPDYVDFRVK